MDEREIAKLFAAVGDPTRLALLRFLLPKEHCVSECTEQIGLTQGRCPSNSRRSPTPAC